MMVKKVFSMPGSLFLALVLMLFGLNVQAQEGNPQPADQAAEMTASISGTLSDWNTHADQVYVFAYPKGTLDAQTESQNQFKNAAASAQVQPDGSFELTALQAGDYQLFFAGYGDENQDGAYEMQGELSVEQPADMDLSALRLGSEDKIELDLKAKGIEQW